MPRLPYGVPPPPVWYGEVPPPPGEGWVGGRRAVGWRRHTLELCHAGRLKEAALCLEAMPGGRAPPPGPPVPFRTSSLPAGQALVSRVCVEPEGVSVVARSCSFLWMSVLSLCHERCATPPPTGRIIVKE